MRYFTIYLFLFSFLNLTSQENSILPISNLRPDTLGIYDTDLLPPIFHKERRKLVRTFMPENSMAIFCSAKNMLRANNRT